MNISPTIQARARQILGLTGGPAIEAIEAIQPVVMIAGEPALRQPQLESGDMIPRVFSAAVEQAAVAAEYAMVQLRVAAGTGAIVHLRQVIIPRQAATGQVIVGRTVNITALNYGYGNWDDLRLAAAAGGALGDVEVVSGSVAVVPSFFGGRYITIPSGDSKVISLDVILCDGVLQGFTVRNAGTNALLQASFQGVIYGRA